MKIRTQKRIPESGKVLLKTKWNGKLENLRQLKRGKQIGQPVGRPELGFLATRVYSALS